VSQEGLNDPKSATVYQHSHPQGFSREEPTGLLVGTDCEPVSYNLKRTANTAWPFNASGNFERRDSAGRASLPFHRI
jgi:hypothetical protein